MLHRKRPNDENEAEENPRAIERNSGKGAGTEIVPSMPADIDSARALGMVTAGAGSGAPWRKVVGKKVVCSRGAASGAARGNLSR